MKSAFAVAAACGFLLSGAVHAAELKVLSSNAAKEAYTELFPQFEKASGHKIVITWAGTNDIKKKIAAGEVYDVIVIASPEMDAFIKDGKVAAGSKADLVKSGVGVAVKAGAPKPDFSSAEALKKTLVAAKSVGYSQGPSGVYMVGLFERMGIADQVTVKAKVVTPGVPVATVVRSGEAEIGFQQVSELIHEPGIDFLGPLPAEIQRITTFSGGIHTQAKEPAAAKALQSFLTAPERAPVLKKHGLSPAA
jgi:molybdate transport system substrate-binding protein